MGKYLFARGTFEDEGCFDRIFNKKNKRLRLASKNHLPKGFFKMGSTDIVVHRCPFELWKLNADGSEIVRLVADGDRIKG